MIVKFKRLDKKAVIPSYAHEGDAGLDLIAVSQTETLKYVQYGTGLAMELPIGYVGLIFPRSSVSGFSLQLANAVGVIDAGYRGEVLVRFKRYNFIGNPLNSIWDDTDINKSYTTGDKVAQLVILQLPQVEIVEEDVLSVSVRGERGFGSTDLNLIYK